MDILEPELIWVDGRCYRFYERGAWKSIYTSAPYMEDKESIWSEEDLENNIKIIDDGGYFKHSFYIPKIFYSYILGTKHAKLKKLQIDTKTIITIPKKMYQELDQNIVITARDYKAIALAKYRIDLLTENLSKRMNHTHFLSIPLNTEEIIDKYNSFKNDILKKYNKAHNIDESLFQISSRLHLTIGMIRLPEYNQKQEAVAALMYCKENIIDPILKKAGSLNIHLKGVASMNDDPAEVQTLFVQVTHNEKLQELVDKVADYFVHIGFKKDYERVKLHMTVMNTLYKTVSQDYTERFNAREILKIHKNTFFGEIILNQIDISEPLSAPKDIYYKSIASITF